jgi:hypothetical protein
LDAEAHIAQYVTVLAHLLLWAVQRACRRFASGNVSRHRSRDDCRMQRHKVPMLRAQLMGFYQIDFGGPN